jgi:aspartyl-tRNA(Asn)/glutamyl-tRNA(Gln) amidotransferase subunit C
MTILRQDIEKLCSLARLALDENEQLDLQHDLDRIVAMVDAIGGVTTHDMEPLAHPLDATARLRTDEVTEHVERDILQQSAPATRNGLYLVPRVID